MSVRLVEIFRSDIVESVHRGSIAVVDSKGTLLYELGDTEHKTFFRSTAKPFIAIAALETGIMEKYGLDLREVALMSSSHSGDMEHIETVKGIMRKANIGQEEIKCGAHEPISKDALKQLLREGGEPSSLHCNCSGKHAGLIAASKAQGMTTHDYLTNQQGIQEKIDGVISDFTGVKKDDITKGTDGCALTVHAVPLRNIALAYTNLCNKEFMNGKYSKSQNYILSAMTMYPEMVAGKGRLDTELMKNFGDRIVCKAGAEGMYCVGILNMSAAIALKIEDGNARATGPVIIETLLQLGIINEEEAEKVIHHWKPDIKNHRGEKVGHTRPCFRLVIK